MAERCQLRRCRLRAPLGDDPLGTHTPVAGLVPQGPLARGFPQSLAMRAPMAQSPAECCPGAGRGGEGAPPDSLTDLSNPIPEVTLSPGLSPVERGLSTQGEGTTWSTNTSSRDSRSSLLPLPFPQGHRPHPHHAVALGSALIPSVIIYSGGCVPGPASSWAESRTQGSCRARAPSGILQAPGEDSHEPVTECRWGSLP